MKKFLKLFNAFAFISAFALTFALVSCKNDDGDDSSSNSKSKIDTITLNIDPATINVGAEAELVVAVEPESAKDEVIYVAEPADAVEINGDKVKGVKSAIVTITAKSKLDASKKSEPVTLTVKLEKPTEATKLSDLTGLWTVKADHVYIGLLIEGNGNVFSTESVFSKEDGNVIQKHYYLSDDGAKLSLDFATNRYSVKDENDDEVDAGTFAVDFNGTNPTLTIDSDDEEAVVYTWTDDVAIPYTEETADQVFGTMTLKFNFDSSLDLSKVKFKIAPAQDYEKYNDRIEDVEMDVSGSTLEVPISGFFANTTNYINILDFEAYDASNSLVEVQLANESNSYFEFVKDGEYTISYAPVSTGTVGFKLTFDGFTLDKDTDQVEVKYGSGNEVKDTVVAEISDDGTYAIAMFKKKYADSYGWFDSISVSVKKGIDAPEVELGGGDPWFEYDETKDDEVVERTLKLKAVITGDENEIVKDKSITLTGAWTETSAVEAVSKADMAGAEGAAKVTITVTGATADVNFYASANATNSGIWIGKITKANDVTTPVTFEIDDSSKIASIVNGGLFLCDGVADTVTVTVTYIAGSGTPPAETKENLVLTLKNFPENPAVKKVLVKYGAQNTTGAEEIEADVSENTATIEISSKNTQSNGYFTFEVRVLDVNNNEIPSTVKNSWPQMGGTMAVDVEWVDTSVTWKDLYTGKIENSDGKMNEIVASSAFTNKTVSKIRIELTNYNAGSSTEAWTYKYGTSASDTGTELTWDTSLTQGYSKEFDQEADITAFTTNGIFIQIGNGHSADVRISYVE